MCILITWSYIRLLRAVAEEIEREVMVGKVLDNTACVTFPTSGLASGSGFLLSLEDDQGMVRDIANVTIV